MADTNEEKGIYCVSTPGSIDTGVVDVLNKARFGEFDNDINAVTAIMEHCSENEYHDMAVYRVYVQRVALID